MVPIISSVFETLGFDAVADITSPESQQCDGCLSEIPAGVSFGVGYSNVNGIGIEVIHLCKRCETGTPNAHLAIVN
jgi:hypothetical protein